MSTLATSVWSIPDTATLSAVLTDIADETSMRNFLRDVMTEKEIIEISARLKVADMLSRGEKYAAVISATKLSSRTIARISDWLQNGTGGYQTALTRLHHAHLPPARAE